MTQVEAAALRVDIIVVNYNYGRFLADAIDSALAQTHPEVGVIVVDDGSEDESREVLRSYEERVDMVLKENGGQASAFNAGMERSDAEVVIFLDSDDMLRPEVAAEAAQALAANPRLSKVQFFAEVVDADGRPTGATKPSPHLPAPIGDQRRAELAFPFDLPWQQGGANAFRADAVRRIFPTPVAAYSPRGADWYLVHLTALLGDSAVIDEVLTSYRVHGENGYEQSEPRLELAHVRDSIVYADATRRALSELAGELGLEAPKRIVSVSDIGNRLLSLRLEPALHPLPGDRVGRLVIDGARAAGRRFDRSLKAKAIYVGWIVAAAVAPRKLVRRLGEMLLFPEAAAPRAIRIFRRA